MLLTEKSLYKLCLEYGAIVGIDNLNPHKLRHSAITLFLDDGGDLRTAQRLGRHKDIKTTMIYDDNRKDLAGEAVNVARGDNASGYNIAYKRFVATGRIS